MKNSFTLNFFMANFSSHVIIMSLIILTPEIRNSLNLNYLQTALIFASMVSGDLLARIILPTLQSKPSICRLVLSGALPTLAAATFLSLGNILFFIMLGAVSAMSGRVFIRAAGEILRPFSSDFIIRYGRPFSILMSTVLITVLLEYDLERQMIFFLFIPLNLVVIFMNKPFFNASDTQNLPNPAPIKIPPFSLKNKKNQIIATLFISFRMLKNTALFWIPIFITSTLQKNLMETAVVIIIFSLLYGCSRITASFLSRYFSAGVFYISASAAGIIILVCTLIFSPHCFYLLSLNGLTAGLLSTGLHNFIKTRFNEITPADILQSAAFPADIFEIIFHIAAGIVSQLFSVTAGISLIPFTAGIFLIYGAISAFTRFNPGTADS